MDLVCAAIAKHATAVVTSLVALQHLEIDCCFCVSLAVHLSTGWIASITYITAVLAT